MVRFRSLIALLGLACLTLPALSVAGDLGIGWDYKTLPGVACQPVTPVDAAALQRSPVAIFNNGGPERGDRSVLCPVVRDTVNTYDLDIGITVTKGVTCEFYLLNYRGQYAAGTPFPPSSTTDLGGGLEIQYFEVKAKGPVDPVGYVGYHVLSCRLPLGGAVFSYVTGDYAKTTDYGE